MRCPGSRGLDGLRALRPGAELRAAGGALERDRRRPGRARPARAASARAVMVRPTPEFFLLMFALFKLGAVPVLVDPGIPRAALKRCLAEAEPEAFIGIPLAHAARTLLGWSPERAILGHGRPALVWGGADAGRGRARLARAARGARDWPTPAPTKSRRSCSPPARPACPRAWSTGTGISSRRSKCCATAFDMQPGGVDLPTFPPFALFDPALGLTSIIPDMDPTRPARADAAQAADAIERFGVDQLFGSPALVAVLAQSRRRAARRQARTLGRRAGAADVVARMRALMAEDAQLWTPYGATECLPVAVIEGRELQATRELTERGAGTCVGRPVPPNRVRIIGISDAADRRLERRPGTAGRAQIGEITVGGPSTTDAYFRRPEATALAKIRETRRRRHRAHRAPHGRPRLVRRAGPAVVLRAQVAARADRAGRPVHRAGRAGVQRASAACAAPRWSASASAARSGRCCASSCEPGVEARTSTRASCGELEHIGQGFAHTGRIDDLPGASAASRSTSATTPRSAASSWRVGGEGTGAT